MTKVSRSDPADVPCGVPAPERLAGRVAILTGAAGALGRVVWQSLENAGASVVPSGPAWRRLPDS